VRRNRRGRWRIAAELAAGSIPGSIDFDGEKTIRVLQNDNHYHILGKWTTQKLQEIFFFCGAIWNLGIDSARILAMLNCLTSLAVVVWRLGSGHTPQLILKDI